AAAVDLSVALAAWMAARLREPTAHAPAAERPRPQLAAAVAAGGGGVALAAEVLWMRGLSCVLSASIYSVTLVLAATLCGIVAGTAAAVRLLRHPGRATAPLPPAGGRGGRTDPR